MNKFMTATKAKNKFGDIIEEVYVKGNTVTITRNSKPVMRVSPVEEYKIEKTPTLTLNDKEYIEVKKALKIIKENFNFDF